MGPIRARLRELRDGQPVGLAAAVEVVFLLVVAGATIGWDLTADTTGLLVTAGAVLAGLVGKWQHDNAIPYPKVRRTADDEQADRDEFADPAEPI